MGDFSRDTFDKMKHYVGVRLQQGVPLVDADWNEMEDIRKFELQAFIKWFVGDGVLNDGFRIEAIPGNNDDFVIKGGEGARCLVEGIDVMIDRDIRYQEQDLYINKNDLAEKWNVDAVNPLTIPKTEREDLVYLDVWEREVDSKENTELLLPGTEIETCVRLKREWAVRVAENTKILQKPPEGHVFYLLASLVWSNTGNISKFEDERRNAAIEEGKIQFSDSGHNHSGGNLGAKINSNDISGTIPVSKIHSDIARESEVQALFNTASGHDHDGTDSKKISPSNLSGVNPSVTNFSLNALTGGFASDASALHHHATIPEHYRRYRVPLLVFSNKPDGFRYKIGVLFIPKFIDELFVRPNVSDLEGIIPLDMPNGARLKTIIILTSTQNEQMNMEVTLYQNSTIIKSISITEGCEKTDSLYDHIIDNEYYNFLVIAQANIGEYFDTIKSIYIHYTLDKLY